MKATAKQISFATAIAEELNIQLPENDFQKMQLFISTNKDNYNKSISIKRLKNLDNETDGRSSTESSFIDHFGIDFTIYVCELLYNTSGIYAFSFNGKIVYIGKSINLGDRIKTSFGERIKEHPIDTIYFLEIQNMADANILEIILIEENKPILNRDCKTSEYPSLFNSGLDIFEDFNVLIKE